MQTAMLVGALVHHFGREFSALDTERRDLVIKDFAEMAQAPDTLAFGLALSLDEAAQVYKKRIGKGNLSAYADSLLAGERVVERRGMKQ